MDDLSTEELEVISNALSYTNKIYQNQIKLIEKSYKERNVELLEYLKSQKSLIRKIAK